MNYEFIPCKFYFLYRMAGSLAPIAASLVFWDETRKAGIAITETARAFRSLFFPFFGCSVYNAFEQRYHFIATFDFNDVKA